MVSGGEHMGDIEQRPANEVIQASAVPERAPVPQIPEEVVRKAALIFADERDYGSETRKKALTYIREWYSAGMPSASQYREHLLTNRGLSRHTIGTIFGFLRNFGEFLVERGMMPFNTFRNVVIRGTRDTAPRRAYSLDEARHILRWAQENAHERDYAIVALMLGTALRTQAVAGINLGDYEVGPKQPRIWVRHKGKWTKDSYVLVYPGLRSALEAWLAVRPALLRAEGSPFFTSLNEPVRRLSVRSIRQIVLSVLQRAGLPGVPHQLRHTAITIARQSGAPLATVKEMAGHKSILTTEIYDHSVQREIYAPEETLDVRLYGKAQDSVREEASGTVAGEHGDRRMSDCQVNS
jgi:integrase/recombinase XerC